MRRSPSKHKVKALATDSFDERMWGGSQEEVVKEIEDFSDDTMWFYKNLDGIRKKYPQKYVAVRSRRIVDSDKKHEKLVQRLEESKEGLSGTQIQFVWPEGTQLIY